MTGDAAPRVIAALASEFDMAGIRRGDLLLVHSSFRTLELPDVRPVDFIATLQDVLGADGTLLMPTYTYSFAGILDVQPYHPAKTPGRANGVLTETLRGYPGAMRSDHPTFSMAAVGREAARLTAGRECASAMGIGSTLHDACLLGAKILLLGVGNDRNSMLHLAEAQAGLPYNDVPFRAFWGNEALVERATGVVERVPVCGELCGCSLHFGVADAFLTGRGISRRVTIGRAPSQLMPAPAAVDAVVERLLHEPDWLLCDSFVCEPCNLRKMRLRREGLC